jgi:hypothetical protein
MSKQYKVGDVVITTQDNFGDEYQGQIIKITRSPHPYRNTEKLFTWYEIAYIFKKGSFTTNDTSSFS